MPGEQIRIDLTAKDDASKTIDKVADAAADLERLSPEVEISADGDRAERAIEDVTDAAKALSRQDAEIVLRAKVDAAKADLKALRDDLDQTGEKAQDTARQLDRIDQPAGGGNLRGNAIADLTGPLGEASSAASDFAGVFDGLGDAAEAAAGKFGLSQSAAGALSTAVGGLGVVVAAGAAAWSFWSQKQEEAKRKAAELLTKQQELNTAIREGNAQVAVTTFKDLYADAIGAADKLGVSNRALTDYIRGLSDELPGVESRLVNLRIAQEQNADAGARGGAAQSAQILTIKELVAVIDAARAAEIARNGTIEEQKRLEEEIARALGLSTDELDANATATDRAAESSRRMGDKVDGLKSSVDRFRDGLNMEQALLTFQRNVETAMTNAGTDAGTTAEDVLAIKQSILDVAEYAKLTPVEIDSLLKAVDAGSIDGVRTLVENAYATRPVVITTKLAANPVNTPPTFPSNVRPGQAVPGSAVGFAATAGDTIHVYQSIPRGYRGDVLADARAASRRAGGMYRRSHR